MFPFAASEFRYSRPMNDQDMHGPKAAQRFPPVVDGPAFVRINGAATSPILLACDHASPAIPAEYGTLGLDATMFHRHIAYDIGAAALTRELSRRLDAGAVLATFTRLLIDPNRAEDDPTLIVKVSDGVFIPGNQTLDADEIERRLTRFHRAYHQAVEADLASLRDRHDRPLFVGVHSFTPIMEGFERPWEVGVLWSRDDRLANALLERLDRQAGLCVGRNEPYSGRIAGYSMDRHGGRTGVAHAVVEVRQDLIDTHHGLARWADLLAAVLVDVRDDPRLAAKVG